MSKMSDVQEFARLLRRSPETTKRDLRRNPSAVPPCLTLPATGLLRWRAIDVERWLEAHVAGGDES